VVLKTLSSDLVRDSIRLTSKQHNQDMIFILSLIIINQSFQISVSCVEISVFPVKGFSTSITVVMHVPPVSLSLKTSSTINEGIC